MVLSTETMKTQVPSANRSAQFTVDREEQLL